MFVLIFLLGPTVKTGLMSELTLWWADLMWYFMASRLKNWAAQSLHW